ncbi:MAG: hydrolase [Endozoicomonas sp.]
MDQNKPFSPPSWLRGAHAQTIWSPLVRRSSQIQRHRERLHWDDGDFIDLDWCGRNTRSPLVALLHGLTGSSDSKYIIGLQHQLAVLDWQSVVINFRGCSGEPNHLPRSYHSGDSGELDAILKHLKKNYPNRQLAAVGYSLGGNVLLKYQGEQAQNSLLDCAVAVSVPFRLDLCAEQMNRGFSRIYRNRFIRQLEEQMQEKLNFFHKRDWKDRARALHTIVNQGPMTTFQEFDHRVTAPLHGFKSGDDYYRQSSCRYYLKTVARPTLILHSKDDPFMTPDTVPDRSELSQDICLELTERGGHVGFISARTGSRVGYWLEQRIPAFLQSHMTESSYSPIPQSTG